MKAKEKGKVQIADYTPLQKKLHGKIQKLVTNKKFHTLTADELLPVFGRVYAVYVCEALLVTGKIKTVKRK